MTSADALDKNQDNKPYRMNQVMQGHGRSVVRTKLLKAIEFVPGGESVWVCVAEAGASVGEDGLELAACPAQLSLIMKNPGQFVPGGEGAWVCVAEAGASVGEDGLELAACP
ncbi:MULTISPECIES: hypothetical protein, partial [unclassified Streptomyces]|uniref:hypothetical protein n=1 Tax=Streptomyces sp. SID4950 TaxID=2690288 RepID=UPI001F376C79